MKNDGRLSRLQREIIPLIQLNAQIQPQCVAKQLGVRERSVRYQISKLEKRGLIRAAPFLNIYPLGYRYVNLYFSVGCSQSSTVERLVQELINTPRVAWLAELGADFHYGLSLIVEQIEDVKEALDSLSRKFPAVFFEKSYAFHLHLIVFPAKLLVSHKLSFPALGYGGMAHKFTADELDRQILAVMAAQGLTSGRAIARSLGRPHATVEHRLRRLEKEGVVAGYWHLMDISQLGYQTLKLLVYAKGHQYLMSQKLLEFARLHPNISYFIECLGSWDFELGLDVENASQVADVTRALYDSFGVMINTVKVVPMFRVLKWTQFSELLGKPAPKGDKT